MGSLGNGSKGTSWKQEELGKRQSYHASVFLPTRLSKCREHSEHGIETPGRRKVRIDHEMARYTMKAAWIVQGELQV